MPISTGRRRSHEARLARTLSMTQTRQRGVALILVLMLAVTASSFVILSALNNRTSRETAQRIATAEALGQARRALLGYALGYADGVHSPDKGPGRLPCPDLPGGEDSGVAEGVGNNCRATNDKETGLLPFRTLGLTALTDGSGAPLWYAVADNFRSTNNGVVNSETAGDFTVDAVNDVVAVIIAPGAPLVGQARTSATAYTAAAWLEGENASRGDNRFTRNMGVANNDTVMIITRAELMHEVAKVVNREVELALASYRADPDGDDDAAGVDPDCAALETDCDDGMPWLAPRSAVSHAGVVGEGRTQLARLPFIQLDTEFDASFTAIWSLSGTGTALFSGTEAPAENCLRNNFCTQLINDKPVAGPPGATLVTFPSPTQGTAAAPWSQGQCRLLRAAPPALTLSVSCTTSYSYSVPGRNLRRVYQLDIGGNTRLVPPSAGARRRVEVRATTSWPAGTLGRITISDFEGSKMLGAARLEFTSFVGGNSLTLTNVPFDLEVWTPKPPAPVDRRLSPGALPPWLLADQWLTNVLVRYAPSEAPGFTGSRCPSAATCVRLNVQRRGDAIATEVNGLRGVVITPGPPLATQSRPSAALGDYFEGLNNSAVTNIYQRRDPSDTFNDQVLPLSP